MNEELLTKAELRKKLKCSGPAIQKWCREGLPHHRYGRLLRFLWSEVDAYFKQRET